MDTRTEDLTPDVDGTAVAFEVTDPFDPGSLVVIHNGLRLRMGEAPGGDFLETEGSDGFIMAVAPLVGDTLQVQYEVEVPTVVASGT